MRSVLAGLRTLVIPWGASGATPRLVLGPNVPAPLQAASPDFTWTAAQIWYFDSTDFYFEAIGLFTVPDPDVPITATGTYVSGTLLFNTFEQTTPPGTLLYGSDTYNAQPLSWSYRNGVMQFFPSAKIQMSSGSSLEMFAGSSIRVDIGASLISENPSIPGLPETWHPAAFQNGWSNFGGTNSPLSYRMVPSPSNCVQLVGVMTPGVRSDGATITTLPIGYRPINSQLLPMSGVITYPGAVSHWTPTILVNPDGTVTCAGLASGAAGPVGVNATFPLDV